MVVLPLVGVPGTYVWSSEIAGKEYHRMGNLMTGLLFGTVTVIDDAPTPLL